MHIEDDLRQAFEVPGQASILFTALANQLTDPNISEKKLYTNVQNWSTRSFGAPFNRRTERFAQQQLIESARSLMFNESNGAKDAAIQLCESFLGSGDPTPYQYAMAAHNGNPVRRTKDYGEPILQGRYVPVLKSAGNLSWAALNEAETVWVFEKSEPPNPFFFVIEMRTSRVKITQTDMIRDATGWLIPAMRGRENMVHFFLLMAPAFGPLAIDNAAQTFNVAVLDVFGTLALLHFLEAQAEAGDLATTVEKLYLLKDYNGFFPAIRVTEQLR